MKTRANNVTVARGAFPVLGHLVPLLRNPRSFLMSLPEQGDLVEIRCGPMRAYVVCNAELTHQVLVNDRVFDKGGPFVVRLREIIGESVSTCPRSEHRRQRRLMQPAFGAQRLGHYVSVMAEEAGAVIDSWRDGEVLDVYAVMQLITTRIAARTMFAASASSALAGQAHDTVNDLILGAGQRMLIPPPFDRIPTPSKARYDRARRNIRKITDAIVRDYRAAGVDHDDLMSMLLKPDDQGVVLSAEEISNQVVTLFLGGIETVASTLGWTLAALALDPDLQRRVCAEVDAVLTGNAPTVENLRTLTYTNGVVLEALRMYPPGWLLTRTTTTDFRLGDVELPAGSTIMYSPFLLGNCPEQFPDPDRFDPDRWSGDLNPVRTGGFVPFGDGPRKCIGDTFSMVELPLIVAAILARWRLEPVNVHIRPLERMAFLVTPHKITVRLVSRNSDYPPVADLAGGEVTVSV